MAEPGRLSLSCIVLPCSASASICQRACGRNAAVGSIPAEQQLLSDLGLGF